ncbi:LexA family transcriptional regulator [Psychrobacter celer]|uniref:LexA family transcriptional regulator n=1 Tax=Psychrobacter celer TaxID=306572 RepID=UPI003FD05CB0
MSRNFSGIEVIRRENTKNLITHSGLSRREFADKSGINYGLLGHYIGKNPTKAIGDEIAQKIEVFFNKPLNWLDHEHGDNEDLFEGIKASETVEVSDDATDMVEIPLYGVYFCCGDGDTNCEFQEVKGTRRFPPSFFRERNIKPENFKLVCASNGSMAPYINDKDEVGLDLGSTEVHDGRVYAILLDGDRMFKQIFREAGGALRLHSFNADYPDRLVTAENHQSLIVVGEQVYRAG